MQRNSSLSGLRSRRVVAYISRSIHDAEGKPATLLYRGDHSFQIRIMGGMGVINSLYWSYYMLNCYVYQGVVVQGIVSSRPPLLYALMMGTCRILEETTDLEWWARWGRR